MQNSITEEKRIMRVVSSLSYHTGNQIELSDLTRGKDPHFFSIRIGEFSIYVDLKDTEAFIEELNGIFTRMMESKYP